VITGWDRPTFLCLTEQHDLQLDADILEARAHAAEMIMLCNPNKPTRVLVPAPVMAEILNEVEATDAVLLLDESFIGLRPETSLVTRIHHTHGFLPLRSFTKFSSAGIERSRWLTG